MFKMVHSSFLVLFCFVASSLAIPFLQEHAGLFDKLALENRISGRIIGGVPASHGDFPYQISLQKFGNHSCGGSILNSQWVMTAAHCLVSALPSSTVVVVGTSNLNEGGVKYKTKNIIVHPEYDSSYHKCDIGLVQVEGEIIFSSDVSAIALPSSDISKANLAVVISGWGRTSLNSAIPEQLQYLNSEIYDLDTCRIILNSLVTDKNICTYTEVGEGLCNGDSGGPVVENGVQVGIVSWGSPCARGYPDVHTKVYSYVSWIKQHVNI